MFCTKCGNNNPDGVRFCTACGAQMAEKVVVKAPMGAPTPKPDSGNNKKIITAAIIVVIVAAIAVGAYFLISGLLGKKDDKANNSSIEDVVSMCEKALKKCDMEMLWKAAMPEDVLDEMIEDEFDGDKDQYREELKETEEEMKEFIDNQEIEIVSLKPDGKEKELSDSDIRDLGYSEKDELLEAIEEEFDIDKVKDIKKCKVELTYEIDGDKEDVNGYAYFYKASGKWYFLMKSSPILQGIYHELYSIDY